MPSATWWQTLTPQAHFRCWSTPQEAPEYDEGDLGEGPRSKRPKQEGEEAGAAAGDEDMGEGDGEGEEEEAPEPAEPTFTPGACAMASGVCLRSEMTRARS